jgi:hypothetical protein
MLKIKPGGTVRIAPPSGEVFSSREPLNLTTKILNTFEFKIFNNRQIDPRTPKSK